LSRDVSWFVASACRASPCAVPGKLVTAFAPHSTLFIQLPLDCENGLPSAKSHTIGIACLPNVLRSASIFGLLSQEQMFDPRSTDRLIANAKYTPTASA